VYRSQSELKLLDMLADPLTQAVMEADRVDLRELIAMLSEIGHVDPGTVGSGSRAGLATHGPALATHC
jgi:hypothetical protein